MSSKTPLPKWMQEEEERKKKRHEEEQERDRKYALNQTVIKFTPLRAETGACRSWSSGVPFITADVLGGYYYCGSHNYDYWDIFPKPIGFIKILPDWITEQDFKMKMIGARPEPTLIRTLLLSDQEKRYYRERDKKAMEEWENKASRRIFFKYEDFVKFESNEGRKFTPKELEQIIRNSDIVTKRSNMYTLSKRLELDEGLNPVGVRRFFETQVFSNPPSVEFTPALLKPYTLSYKRVYDIDPNKPPYDSGHKVVPVPLYSGLFYGDTCCGKVFREMKTEEEKIAYNYNFPHTFKDNEERNAFFLQICKMVIAGIEKDGNRAQDCVNHGNYGDCIVDFFKMDSDYDFPVNTFLKNRIIMLLFHKVIEINEKMREVLQLENMKSKVVDSLSKRGVYLNSMGEEKQMPSIPRYRKKIMDDAMGSVLDTDKFKKDRKYYASLLDRYFNVIIEIMKNTEYIDSTTVLKITKQPNPLNIELCSAEVELVPSAPDREGNVRYVAKFAKPRNPDGRTMAHLLAERCPRILMRLMVDPAIKHFFVLKFDDDHDEKYQNSNFYVEPSKRFIPNPIAYLLPDINGDTPKSLAIAQLTNAFANANLEDMRTIEGRALQFFSSLPEPQPQVFVEREQFMKRNMGSSKLRSAIHKLSAPDLSTGLRKMFKSQRDFLEASQMEGLLTGRNPSMATGKPSQIREQSKRTVQPTVIVEDKETIIPEGMGGGRTRRKGLKKRLMKKHRHAYTRKHRTSYKKRSLYRRRR